MQTQRSIGAIGLFLFSMGSIVGSAWLLGPFVCAKMTGPSAVLAWFLGGLLMISIGLTFAELGCMFPTTGSSARFLQWSHGTLVSFVFAWIAWISSLAVAPIETLAMLQYADNYFPWLMIKKEGAYVLSHQGMAVAAAVMGLMCVINTAGTRWLSYSSSWLSLWKIVIPSLAIVILLCTSFHAENFTHSFFSGGFQGVLSSLPAGGILAALMGYTAAVQMGSEIKRPQRVIPLVIISTIIVSTVLYAALQFAFIGAMPADAIRSGWANLHYPGDAGPFIGLLTLLGVFLFVKILYADVFISPFGSGLAYTGMAARMMYAMGDNGYLPKILHKLNKSGVPGRLIVIDIIIGFLFLFPFPTWQFMMSFLVSCAILAYAVGPLALVVLRKKMPDKSRPFRLPYANSLSFLAFYTCNMILVWTGWSIIQKLLVFIVLGYLLLFLFRLFQSEEKQRLDWHNMGWLLLYFLFIGSTSFLSGFGGKNVISFGWDFLVIFAESIIIFLWSKRCALQH